MQIENDGETVIMHVQKEESEVIKTALCSFVNTKDYDRNVTSKERAINREDKKIALKLYSQFPEP